MAATMEQTTLIIDAVLVLAMIVVSLFGAITLPAGAMVPVHFGRGFYNTWMPKSVGLLIHPLAGLVVFALAALPLRSASAGGAAPPTAILTLALLVMLVVQILAIRMAFGRAGGGGG
jgi:hypothetical protein